MLIDEILSLHTARERIKRLKALEDELYQLLLQTELGRGWFNTSQTIKDWKKLAKEFDSAAREMTVAQYEETGDKHPVPGVGIRVYKGKPRLDVKVDEPTLISWVRTNAPTALKVDEEMLLEMVEKGKIPGYIATACVQGGGPRATVATDLSEAVEEING
mgnify:CR=1 FL=1